MFFRIFKFFPFLPKLVGGRLALPCRLLISSSRLFLRAQSRVQLELGVTRYLSPATLLIGGSQVTVRNNNSWRSTSGATVGNQNVSASGHSDFCPLNKPAQSQKRGSDDSNSTKNNFSASPATLVGGESQDVGRGVQWGRWVVKEELLST